MHILTLMAHPDDAEIYVFGSLCAWQAMGARLSVAIATQGEGGKRTATQNWDAEQLAQHRWQETSLALADVDVVPQALGCKDGALAQCGDLVQRVQQLIKDAQPDLVVTHDPMDYHSDHRALSLAVRQAASFKVPVLYADTLAGTHFEPTVYVDITRHMARKEAAILRHISQEPERFVRNARLQNAFRAYQCHAGDGAFAECFRFEASYPFSDIRALLPPAPPLKRLG